MAYEKVTKDEEVVMFVKDGTLFIPVHEGNRHYKEYSEWKDENPEVVLEEYDPTGGE